MSLKLAVLASGSGTNFQAMVDAVRRGALDADIRLVICNRPGAKVIERAKAAGIICAVMDHKLWPSREAYDLAVADAILKSGAVCLTADGPVSLEMEKYFRKMRRDFPMSAQRVLELNPDAPAFQALCKAYEEDKEKAAAYVEVLYNQALIIADLPLPDPARYAELVCGLMK